MNSAETPHRTPHRRPGLQTIRTWRIGEALFVACFIGALSFLILTPYPALPDTVIDEQIMLRAAQRGQAVAGIEDPHLRLALEAFEAATQSCISGDGRPGDGQLQLTLVPEGRKGPSLPEMTATNAVREAERGCAGRELERLRRAEPAQAQRLADALARLGYSLPGSDMLGASGTRTAEAP